VPRDSGREGEGGGGYRLENRGDREDGIVSVAAIFREAKLGSR